jgi:8-oxo-dGTP pyrophosphatase MutT (NUDIX family)
LSGPGADLVAAVRRSLEKYSPLDPESALVKEEALEFLVSTPEPFDMTLGNTHMTASAMVVGRRGMLLHRHKRLGIWLQPGGHIDPGETPWAAAERETAEETGLAVDVTSPADTIPGVFNVDVHNSAGGHVHLDLCYLATPRQDRAPSPPAGESQEVAWFSVDEALRIGDARISAMANQVRFLDIGVP